MYALDGMLFKIIHETFEFFPGGCNESGIAADRRPRAFDRIFENSRRSRPEAAKKKGCAHFRF
jgi:hypothetical protein